MNKYLLNKDLSDKARLRVNPELMVVEEHGTVYLIPPLEPPLRLNRSASDIWRLATQTLTVIKVIEEYAVLYNCSLSEATEDVSQFLTSMLKSSFFILEDS